MSFNDYLLMFPTSIIAVFIDMLAYNKLSNKKIYLNFKFIIVILISSLLIMINTYTNDTLLRTIFSFVILYFTALILYDDSYIESFVYILFCQIFIMFFEIILSILVLKTNIIDLNGIDNSLLFKTVFSFVNISLVYLLLSLKCIKILSSKVINLLNKNKYILIILSLILLFLIVLDFRYIINLSSKTYFINMILLLCFSIVIIFSIYNYFKSQKEVEKIDSLLSFMTKYEKIIDDDRIKRHEMLNNLLLLKSFDDKNCEDYNNTLNEIIGIYSNNGMKIKNIYKLPHGLKGVFYYKLYNLENTNTKVNLNISNKISNSLSKLNNKDYTILCKIIGITLDNAIEASKNSKDKFINVDVYKENKIIYIIIENSCRRNIDISKISEKNYSTKGKGRGLGLYIANKLLSTTDNLTLEQFVKNNIFTTKIVIK